MTALIKSLQHRCRRVLHLIAQRSAQFARMGLNRLLGQDAPPPDFAVGDLQIRQTA